MRDIEVARVSKLFFPVARQIALAARRVAGRRTTFKQSPPRFDGGGDLARPQPLVQGSRPCGPARSRHLVKSGSQISRKSENSLELLLEIRLEIPSIHSH